jgi:hypothetical protein
MRQAWFIHKFASIYRHLAFSDPTKKCISFNTQTLDIMEGEAHLAEQTAVGALHLHSLLVPRIGVPATTALGFFQPRTKERAGRRLASRTFRI